MHLPVIDAAAWHERGELLPVTGEIQTVKLWPHERLIVLAELRGGILAEWRGLPVLVPSDDYAPENGEATFITDAPRTEEAEQA